MLFRSLVTMQRNKKTNGGPRRRGTIQSYRENLANSIVNQPPPIQVVPSVRHVVDLVSTAAQSEFDVTVKLVCQLFAVCTTANTTMKSLVYAMRLRRLSMWGNAGASNAPTALALEWNTGGTSFIGKDSSIRVTCLNSSIPAYLTGVPPKGTLADFWNSNESGSANVLCSLTWPANTFIRVEFDAQYIMTENPSVTTAITAAAGVGLLAGVGWNATTLVQAPLNNVV